MTTFRTQLYRYLFLSKQAHQSLF